MKRKALLIGNSSGLSGVKIDIANIKSFLINDIGGLWDENEILTFMNPSRLHLMSIVNRLKNEMIDYVIVYFSGHGAYERNTVLEINENEEYIYESDLRNIAPRQLLIFDCCRNVISTPLFDSKTIRKSLLFGTTSNIRAYYDQRIMQSIEQQTSLYACSINESSYDTNDGGIYTNCLLSSVLPSNGRDFKLVSEAQEEARPKTFKMANDVYSGKQTPDQSIPKCMNSQQLIISINPSIAQKSPIFG